MTDNKMPPSVYVRKYIFQLIIAALTLVFLTVLSLSVCKKAAESHAERERYASSPLNETVFTASADYGECFYNFAGGTYAFTEDGERLNTDIFMTVSGHAYAENPIGFKGTLSVGECALSENLAHKHKLSVGDVMLFSVGTDEKQFTFKISDILPSQSGVDGKYMHEGIVILAEDNAFAEVGKHIFTSFIRNGDEYKSLVDDPARGSPVVYAEDIIKNNEQRLYIYAIISFASFLAFVALCEMLIFRKTGRKYRDYFLLKSYGMSTPRLFYTVCLDNCIKYILPLFINYIIWNLRLCYLHMSYTVPAAVFMGGAAGFITGLTAITVMRRNKCLKIER